MRFLDNFNGCSTDGLFTSGAELLEFEGGARPLPPPATSGAAPSAVAAAALATVPSAELLKFADGARPLPSSATLAGRAEAACQHSASPLAIAPALSDVDRMPT
jgi:hypothetical protein